MITFQTFQTQINKEKSKEISLEIGKILGWRLKDDNDNLIQFVSNFNFKTWGEIITVDFISETDINITIETKFSQLGDEGSGSLKIKQFVEHFFMQRSKI